MTHQQDALQLSTSPLPQVMALYLSAKLRRVSSLMPFLVNGKPTYTGLSIGQKKEDRNLGTLLIPMCAMAGV